MPWNLPFQLDDGSQTSKRISESEEGFIDPATRQKAGRLGMGLASGTVNSPGGRDSAIVIVVFGSAKAARLSQVVAAPDNRIGKMTVVATKARFMGCSF